MYDIVALDIDGTLLPHIRSVTSQRTREALERVRQAGGTIALASGRAPFGLRHIAQVQGVELEDLYLIGFNGASIVQAWDGTEIVANPVGLDLAREAIAVGMRAGLTVLAPYRDRVFVNRLGHDVIDFETVANGTTAVCLDDLTAIDVCPGKIIFGADPDELAAFEKELKPRFEGRAEIALSAPFVLEFNPVGVTKGVALEALCDRLGVPLERSVAFGDHFNDLPMLQAAGLGVAMANGIPQAHRVADRIAPPCEEDGVAQVLEELFPASP